MKNVLFFLIAVLAMASCARENPIEEPFDKWNGYGKYLKGGDTYHILWAAQYDNVGLVTYGLTDTIQPDSGFFYVIYQCNEGYTMSETHLYAGDKKYMPMSKIVKNVQNQTSTPKIGLFPYGEEYDTPVSTDTFYINCLLLPPVDTGFVVAAHCVVNGPAGYNETGWADGDRKFTEKGWGMYDTYSYEPQQRKFTILYGTAYVNDTLKLYHIDLTNGTTDLILKEVIGNNYGIYDAAAYDVVSGKFFFANYNTGQLFVNNLEDEGSDSFLAGTLIGTPASGTFGNSAYYYIDEGPNTINKVSFTSNWGIAEEVILDTIPSTIAVNDIAMSLDGNYIYILGEVNGGGRELIKWEEETETFYSTSIAINAGAQIAYGNDGILYAIAPISEGSPHSITYIINTTSDTLVVIPDDVIIITDSFSDISIAPIK